MTLAAQMKDASGLCPELYATRARVADAQPQIALILCDNQDASGRSEPLRCRADSLHNDVSCSRRLETIGFGHVLF
ncbi:hypothetical protein [Phenylobacterium sp.]|uniref:hypothetical protein n=1 Tax=Phenylobacterium sp. TaxID=1871053 RepID=UPI003D2E436F